MVKLLKKIAFLTVVAIAMTSCTSTVPAISRTQMNQTVDQVKVELKQHGYYSSGFYSEQKSVHDYGSIRSKSGAGHEDMESNAMVNVDTYQFENSEGEKMVFQVQYMVKNAKSGFYLADVSTMGCQTTNVKDYEDLCGSHSPIKKLDSMPKDGKVKVANPTGTLWLSVGVTVGILAATLVPILVLLL